MCYFSRAKILSPKVFTAFQLGMVSIFRVVVYRIRVRIGLSGVPLHSRADLIPNSIYFDDFRMVSSGLRPRSGWYYYPEAFGLRIPGDCEAPFDWHYNVISNCGTALGDKRWSDVPDFDESIGDIKGIWESSRFDWVLSQTQHASLGSGEATARLNDWLCDWVDKNPPYYGPNWKCGQEASIRVLHLAVAAIISGQHENARTSLLSLVRIHLDRINPTLMYAVGQNNNHGTSEAAALFVGGSWLESCGFCSEGKWSRIGRKWLENRVRRLVFEDGSFSQYSLNYHRFMLDTICVAEIWRRALNLAPFSDVFYQRARAATAWLGNLVDDESGDAPNFGANDGARLIPLSDTDYRDYRPSVQLASLVFFRARAFQGLGLWDQPALWLGIDVDPKSVNDWHTTQVYNDGGYAVLRQKAVMAVLHFPRYKFRPGQSHILHLDLWVGGGNLLRDGGSYSYNCDPEVEAYFSGVASHNTVQFDDRDQMPRFGRFLFGMWPKAKPASIVKASDGSLAVSSAYRDWLGAEHHRAVILARNELFVTDKVSGKFRKATLRWRLCPGLWKWQGDVLTNGSVSIEVNASHSLARRELVEGWESRYYSQKTPIPVLEIDAVEPCSITTRVTF